MDSTCSLFSFFFLVSLIPTIVIGKFPTIPADENVETIDIDSRGRGDVRTILNLSPWELFVLNDLFFKLTIKQCPAMNKNLLASLKELISSSFKAVPVGENQNAQFLTSYGQLVRCLEFLEKSAAAQEEIKQQNEEIGVPFANSKESDWEVKDAVITTTTTTTTETVFVQQEEIQVGSTWLWGFRSLHRLLVNYLGKDESNEVLSLKEKEKEAAKQRAKEQERLALEKEYRGARQSFADFFHEMSKVIGKTCPIIHRPDKLFMRNVLLDMTTWATTAQIDTISSATLYFKKHKLIHHLHQCFKRL